MTTLDEGAESPLPEPRAFAVRCAAWLAAALAAMGLLWLIGFEAVLYRAAPLHARPDAILGDLRVLPSVALAMAFAAWLLRRTALDRPAPVHPGMLVAWTAGTAIIGAAWAIDPDALPLLAYHALAVAVFTAGMGLLLNAAAVIGLPNREPSARSALAMAAGITVFAFVFAGSAAMIRGGTGGLEALAAQPALAYVNDLDKVGAPYALFRDFTGMHPALSDQARMHPPGAVLLVWGAALIVADSSLGIVLSLMALAALAVIPLYGWVAAMASRRAALLAAMLYSVMPGAALFATGSVDAALAPFTLTVLYAYARALRDRSPSWALTAGALFACVTLMHFALLSLVIWFVFTGILHATRDAAARTALLTWGAAALGFLCVHGLLSLITGFDYHESFRLAWGVVHGHSWDEPRAAWYWWPMLTPLALAFYAGPPVCLLALHAIRALPASTRPLARCGVIAFACLALTYLGTGEGERAAYYAYPFLVLPAALMLEESSRRRESLALPAAAMGLCAVQVWIMQSYFQI